MLGIARGGEENGGFSSRGGRAGVTNIGGEEFGIVTCGLGGRVVVNFCRSYVWRHKTVIHVGIGRNSRGRRGRVGKRERVGSHASDEELDEDTGEESNEEVNQGEPPLLGRIIKFLRGEQGFILVAIRSVVVLGARPRLDVLWISGVHTVESKRCCPLDHVGKFPLLRPASWLYRTSQPGLLVSVHEPCV